MSAPSKSKLSADAPPFVPIGSGGGGGGKQPSVPQPQFVFQPIIQPTGRFHYEHEFQTVAQKNAGRGRTMSFGIYDPSTDMRTNRVHVHYDDLGGNTMPHSKPDEAGRSEVVHQATRPVTYTPEMVHAGWAKVPITPLK